MKRAIRFLARLYPAAWRRRYGAEFDALLEDESPTLGSAMNVLLGAVRAHVAYLGPLTITAIALACGMGLAARLYWPAPRGFPAVMMLAAPQNKSLSQPPAVVRCALNPAAFAKIAQSNEFDCEPSHYRVRAFWLVRRPMHSTFFAIAPWSLALSAAVALTLHLLRWWARA
jgi:hypothetical protein